MVAYVILDFMEMRQEMENIGNVFLIFLNASVKRIRAGGCGKLCFSTLFHACDGYHTFESLWTRVNHSRRTLLVSKLATVINIKGNERVCTIYFLDMLKKSQVKK